MITMDSKTSSLVSRWQSSLTQRERELHELAAKMLKKSLIPKDPIASKEELDNGSYYPDQCHAFRAWKKEQGK